MNVSEHFDKIGIAGSIVTALCCLGTPAALSVVAALGLGFLINDAILVPLLAAFLLVTLLGLTRGWKRHGTRSALALGVASALLLFASVLLVGSTLLAYLALVGVIVASFLNVALARPRHARSLTSNWSSRSSLSRPLLSARSP